MINAGRVAIVPKGEYVHGTQYTRLDAVRYKNGIYLAKKDNVSQYPTVEGDNDYWMYMVSMDDVKYADEAGKVSNALSFSGLITDTYDGSNKKNVNIPNVLTGHISNPEGAAIEDIISYLHNKVLSDYKSINADVKQASSSIAVFGIRHSQARGRYISMSRTNNRISTYRITDDGSAIGLLIPDLLTSLDEVYANTGSDHAVDALVIKEIINHKKLDINDVLTNSFPDNITWDEENSFYELITPHLIHIHLSANSIEAVNVNSTASASRWALVKSPYRPKISVQGGVCRTKNGFGVITITSTGYVCVSAATEGSTNSVNCDAYWTF